MAVHLEEERLFKEPGFLKHDPLGDIRRTPDSYLGAESSGFCYDITSILIPLAVPSQADRQRGLMKSLDIRLWM